MLVSLLTRPPAAEKVSGLTFATADQQVAGIEAIEHVGDRGRSDPIWRRLDARLSIVVVVLVAIVMVYFSNLFS